MPSATSGVLNEPLSSWEKKNHILRRLVRLDPGWLPQEPCVGNSFFASWWWALARICWAAGFQWYKRLFIFQKVVYWQVTDLLPWKIHKISVCFGWSGWFSDSFGTCQSQDHLGDVARWPCPAADLEIAWRPWDLRRLRISAADLWRFFFRSYTYKSHKIEGISLERSMCSY